MGETIGLFEAAEADARDIAVLFAGAWGVEDLCSHRFIRMLAERFSANGIASLRFDYPGTCDALTDTATSIDLDSWTDSLVTSASLLKQTSGCHRIAIVAQGIGAPLAALAAPYIPGVDAMVLMAPVVSGRTHVRELSAFLHVSAEKLLLRPDIDADAIAEVSLPAEVAAGLRTVDLLKLPSTPAGHILVFARQERPADGLLAGHLKTLGADVTEKPFEGYDRLTVNPLLATVPETVIDQTIAWVSDRASDLPTPKKSVAQPLPTTHGTHEYAETPVRFGRSDRLFGIVCDPAIPAAAPASQVLLLSAGYERQSGWGGYTARLARDLARFGISSLRFDCSNVADSPPVEGHAGQVLYSDIQVVDLREALDFMGARSPAPIIAAGRCTGAYLAFQTALADTRLAGMVGINPEVFIWPQNRPIDSALTQQTQPLKHYGRRFLELRSLKKALKGEINLVRKSAEIGFRLKQHAMRPLSKAIGGLSARERAVYEAFETLQNRQMPVTLLYSPDDIGMEERAHFFGGDGANRYPAITTTVIADATHTFMQKHARAAYLDAIVKMAGSV